MYFLKPTFIRISTNKIIIYSDISLNNYFDNGAKTEWFLRFSIMQMRGKIQINVCQEKGVAVGRWSWVASGVGWTSTEPFPQPPL